MQYNTKKNKKKGNFKNISEARKWVVEKLQYLETSRPTAVNLFKMSAKVQNMVQSFNESDGLDCFVEMILKEAFGMLDSDIADNKAIGDYAVKAMLPLCTPNRYCLYVYV